MMSQTSYAGMEGMPTLNKRYNQETTQVEQEESYWYALKVFFNKVFDVEETLNGYGISTYIPCETQGNGHERKPMINSLIFFRSSPTFAQRVNTLLYNKAFVYTSSTDMGKKPYAIPEKEMNIFMLVCSSGESGLEYFGTDDSFFRKGDRVKVVDGVFKGAEGYIRRIRGNRRLFVSIHGVCAVATSYIPQCFLRKIQNA